MIPGSKGNDGASQSFYDNFKANEQREIDPKTKLQEFSLKKFKTLPIYKLINTTGPKHKPVFKIAVRLKNSEFVDKYGLYLPNHANLNFQDIDFICKIFKKIAKPIF